MTKKPIISYILTISVLILTLLLVYFGTPLLPKATTTKTVKTQINSINSAQGTAIADSIDADVRIFGVVFLYPVANDTIPLFRVPENITITSVYAGIKGGTSATYSLGWHTSMLGTLEEVFASPEVCSSSTGSQAGGGLENSTPDAGEWLQAYVSAVSGTVKSLVITVTYTKR